jgi:hypothetical protein
MDVLWELRPYSLVDDDRRFKGRYRLYHHLTMEAVRCTETSVNIYETTLCKTTQKTVISVIVVVKN